MRLEVGGALRLRLEAKVNANYKSQNPNNKQITMTEIVRASLGLPTLRAGPKFQNFKRSHHLKKREFQYIFGSLNIGI
jgi:hypothetical protein